MDQKRLLLFLVLSIAIFQGWLFLTARPKPAAPKPVAKQAQEKLPEAKRPDDGDEPADRDRAVAKGDAGTGAAEEDDQEPGEKGAPQVAGKDADEGEKRANEEKPPAAQPAPAFPFKTAELGSLDPKTGYRQLVTLISRGAAIDKIEMSDPHYRALEKPHPALTVVGDKDFVPRTLELSIPQLKDVDFSRSNWELKQLSPEKQPHSLAVFQLAADGVEVEKRYELNTIDQQNNSESPAYALAVELTFRNTGRKPRTINYVLQGPTGVPLENAENTQKFRDVVVGFETKPDRIDSQVMTAKTIVDGKTEEWKQALKYIGVDCQFFAALVCPDEDQLKTKYVESAKQQLLVKDPKFPERSEISVELTSIDLQLGAKDSVTHSYHLFAGPTREDVLPAGAGKVLDFGWFPPISRFLLWLLKTFYAVVGNWGIAIICLTVVVRGAMFPISIRQARSAAKMQAIQPEIQALKEKYGNDKEKFARAQMELYRKHKFNPFGGCLPLFIQLPIFMGLYQALNHAVDLRLAGFLWIDNLAAPDALFRLPFPIPILGWHDFNLLPLITTGLFLVQQKMFMPPAVNEEQALQQKMMNIMTVVMGAVFYKVPAGLCVYFIASSLWGIGERKLLPKFKPATTELKPPDPPQTRRKGPDSDDDDDGRNGGGGLWAMLLKAAEKETSARRPTRK